MDSHRDIEQDLITKRRFAPMPRRRAGNETEEGATGSMGTNFEATYAANELARAAEELLEHFETHEEKGSVSDGAGKANRTRGRAQDAESNSSIPGQVKISGVITPDQSSSSKNGLSEDGNITVSLTDTYTPTWPTRARSSSAGSSSRTHDCEADGCYGLTARFIDDDRLSDDYAARGGGKKRKVPASAQQGPSIAGERDESVCGHTCGHVCDATTSSIVDRMNRTASDDTQSHSPTRCCCSHHSTIRIVPDPVIHIPKRRTTPARTAREYEKRLFLGRKAQVMGLLADAVTCLGQAQGQERAQGKQGKSGVTGQQGKGAPVEGIPSKDELEELVQALEYTGVSGWEGDRVGSGAVWDGHVLRGRIKGGTLTGTSTTTTTETGDQPKPGPGKLKWRKRGRVAERFNWLSRKPVKRGGWIPEGTFEFEMPSSVAASMQKSTHDLHALRAKVTQLLTLTLSSPSMTSFLNGKPNPMVPLAQAKGDTGAAKTVPKDDALVPAGKRDGPADVHRDVESNPPGPTSATALAPSDVQDDPAEQKLRPKAHQNAHNVIVEPSADDPDYVPPPFGNAAGAKKGKKKKKKSAMANAANPHHVKNYVPSRRPVNPPQADMPNLVDFLSMLFFPPPTRFLNSKPRRNEETQEAKPRRREPARAAADGTDEEYVCCFCEYDLFFGSEQAMDKAVRRRKKVLERRQKAQEKAAGLIAGRGLRSKPARGESEDERCAGGEQCRCAEIRSQEGRNRDADSRGIEDTYSDEGDDYEPDEEETELASPDVQEQPAPEEGVASASTQNLVSADPSKTVMPVVETFDLDEGGS